LEIGRKKKKLIKLLQSYTTCLDSQSVKKQGKKYTSWVTSSCGEKCSCDDVHWFCYSSAKNTLNKQLAIAV